MLSSKEGVPFARATVRVAEAIEDEMLPRCQTRGGLCVPSWHKAALNFFFYSTSRFPFA